MEGRNVIVHNIIGVVGDVLKDKHSVVFLFDEMFANKSFPAYIPVIPLRQDFSPAFRLLLLSFGLHRKIPSPFDETKNFFLVVTCYCSSTDEINKRR